jgi:hypothetical protein
MSTITRQPSSSAPSGAAPQTPERPTLQLSLPQVLGSALAAATSALAASFLGVAGTLIGAVFGAVIATIGGALYSHSLGMAALRMKVVRQVTSEDGSTVTVDTRPLAAVRGRDDRRGGPDPSSDAKPLRHGRRWIRLSTGVALGVVLALAGITAVELVMGHPVSGSTSPGTSIGQAVGASSVADTSGTSVSSPASATAESQTATPASSATASAPISTGTTASATETPAGASASPEPTASATEPAG